MVGRMVERSVDGWDVFEAGWKDILWVIQEAA